MWRQVFTTVFYFCLSLTFSTCIGQHKPSPSSPQLVGGPCEGCEAAFEFGKRTLTPVDTLPDFRQTEPKLKVRGTVYQKGGKVPAENVIVYIYHTNRQGIYETKGDEVGLGKRHGYIRGWVQTKKNGAYTFYTFRPAAYPDGREPQHIHIHVKEPDINEYYIDSILFDDDPLLTEEERVGLANRAGSGIVHPILENGIWTVTRDIILGENIPGYP